MMTAVPDAKPAKNAFACSSVTAPLEPGTTGTPQEFGQLPRFGFVAEHGQQFGTWPDKFYTVAPGGFRELKTFAEKAVPGMNRIAAGLLRDANELGGIQIGRRPLARYLPCAVGPPYMHALRVVFGVDRDGLDAEFGSRARDADGNLAAIGNKEFR